MLSNDPPDSHSKQKINTHTPGLSCSPVGHGLDGSITHFGIVPVDLDDLQARLAEQAASIGFPALHGAPYSHYRDTLLASHNGHVLAEQDQLVDYRADLQGSACQANRAGRCLGSRRQRL